MDLRIRNEKVKIDPVRCICLLVGLCCGALAQIPDFDKPVFKTDMTTPQPDDAALIAAACPGGKLAGKEVLCSTNCKTFPGGGSDWAGGWKIAGVLRGHFLAADSEDAVLAEEGCLPHSAFFGGSFLVAKRSNGWVPVRFRQGLITNQCHKFAAADGRDVLICQHSYGGQGYVFRDLQFVDLRTPPTDPDEVVFRTVNTLATCGESATDGPNFPVENNSIDRIEYTAASMTVYARYGRAALNRGQVDACSREHWPSVPTKAYQIHFLFDGKSFHVAPGSRDAAKLFAQ